MYIHIGNNCVINEKDIVAVFDFENSSISKKTREFLNFSEKNKNIKNVSTDIPRSFIVCKEKGKETVVYLSQLTSVTIQKRNYKNKKIGYRVKL